MVHTLRDLAELPGTGVVDCASTVLWTQPPVPLPSAKWSPQLRQPACHSGLRAVDARCCIKWWTSYIAAARCRFYHYHLIIYTYLCLIFHLSLSLGLLTHPGDKLYPVDSPRDSEAAKNTAPQSKDHQDASPLHRIVISDPYTLRVQITITPKYNHVLPVAHSAVSHDSKSQLWQPCDPCPPVPMK